MSSPVVANFRTQYTRARGWVENPTEPQVAAIGSPGERRLKADFRFQYAREWRPMLANKILANIRPRTRD